MPADVVPLHDADTEYVLSCPECGCDSWVVVLGDNGDYTLDGIKTLVCAECAYGIEITTIEVSMD